MFLTGETVEPTILEEDIVSRVEDGVVYRRNRAYRLSVASHEGGRLNDTLESEDLAYLRKGLETFESARRLNAEWHAGSVERIERDLGEGYRISASKHPNQMMHVLVHDANQEIVGKLACEPSCWQAEFVLGERTFSGSILIDKNHERRGFATMLHDLAEEVCGLPTTAHGRNQVQGMLTNQGESFWNKRATIRRTPGFGDPVAAERNVLWHESRRPIALDNFDRTEIINAVEIAKHQGHGIILRIEHQPVGLPDMNGWCVDGTGRVVAGICGETFPACPPEDAMPVMSAEQAETEVRKVLAGTLVASRTDEIFERSRGWVEEFLAYETKVAARMEKPQTIAAY